jgi:chromosome segregation ATPase
MKFFTVLFSIVTLCCAPLYASEGNNDIQKVKSWKYLSYFYHLLKGDVSDRLTRAIEETNKQNSILKAEVAEKTKQLEQLNKESQEKIAFFEKILSSNIELIKKLQEDLSQHGVTTNELKQKLVDAQTAYDNVKKQIADHDFKISDFQKSLVEHRQLFENVLSKTDNVVKDSQTLIDQFKSFAKGEDKIIDGVKQEIAQNKELLQKIQKDMLVLTENNASKIEKLQEELGGNKVVCQQLHEELQKLGKNQKSL